MIIDQNPRMLNYGNEAREALIAGAQAVAKAVAVTLGPRGRHVVIDKTPHGNITVTKDGVTVAKEVNPIDITENTGAQLFKKAAIYSVEHAGDGTTTATVLANYLLTNGFKLVKEGINPMELVRGMQLILPSIIENLNSQSIAVETLEDIKKVAYISCNNDAELGDLVAEVLYKITKDGIAHVEESATINTTYTITNGMKFDTGTSTTSRYFVTDAEKMVWEKENCIIILSEDSITSMSQLVPIFEKSNQTGQPVLIIAKDFEDTVLNNVVSLYMRGQINCCLVQSPGWGDIRRARLLDIAAVTGALIFAPNAPIRLTDMNAIDNGGLAGKVIVKENELIIIEGAAISDEGHYRNKYDSHVQLVKNELEATEDPYDKDILKSRLATLVGGSAVIKVGGYSKEEIGEKKDRIDDAINAVKCAMKKGIVPGGGIALIQAFKHVRFTQDLFDSDAEAEGGKLVMHALSEPLRIILSNAGVNVDKIISNIAEKSDVESAFGYNAKTLQYENDMILAGIVDPLLVTTTALTSAVNIAAMMLTTDCLINYHVIPQNNG